MLFVKRNGNKTDCIHYRKKIRPTFNSVFLSMCSGSKPAIYIASILPEVEMKC